MKRAYHSSRDSAVFFFAITMSILWTLWLNYHQSIINPDAICYLLSAEEVGESGIRGAMQLCGQAKWPFYSALIYGFAKISHLSYLMSAYVVNAFCSLLLVTIFISIVKELGGRGIVLWLAAGVILLHHTLNSARDYIIRDHGFWACYLISLLLLLRYFRRPHWGLALSFSLSLFIAALFRVEGVVFLILLPFLAWFHSEFTLKERFKHFLSLNLLLLVIALLGGVWLLFHPEITMTKLGRLGEIPYQIKHSFILMIKRFAAMKYALATRVLVADSAQLAGMILFFVLIAWYFVSVIFNLSWIYATILFYGWWKKSVTFRTQEKIVLFGYISVNLLITSIFLLERNFLSKRYLMALSLVFLLWIPFILNDLIQKAYMQSSKKRYQISLVFIVLLILLTTKGDFFTNYHSKAYIKEAGQWIAQNIAKEDSLYINDYQLMYYSNRYGKHIFEAFNEIPSKNFNQYHFLALRFNKNTSAIRFFPKGFFLVEIFQNSRGDGVAIYKAK